MYQLKGNSRFYSSLFCHFSWRFTTIAPSCRNCSSSPPQPLPTPFQTHGLMPSNTVISIIQGLGDPCNRIDATKKYNPPTEMRSQSSSLIPTFFSFPFQKINSSISEIQNLGNLCQDETTSYLVCQIQVLYTFHRNKDGVHITCEVRIMGKYCKPFESLGF